MTNHRNFTEALASRILVLDGGFGTMLQSYNLGSETTASPDSKGGCNDLLSVTRPEIVSDIHRRYLEAGADIIETNSFNANGLSLADYGLQHQCYEIARAGAEVARKAADEYSTDAKPRFVAGSVGPTNRTLSMSADVNAPGARDVTFQQMYDAYYPQIQGLIDGGADLIIVETVFDTLNAKAALAALRDISPDMPVVVSMTVSDASGRTLTGQTIDAFVASVMHAHPVAVGLNCGFGAKGMLPFLRHMAQVSTVGVSVHPNAGLPNINGGYDETPEMFVADTEKYLREGLVNIVGGCCGTTPEHIALLAKAVEGYTPRKRPDGEDVCVVSGLETLRITPDANFINIGERTNVAGSAKFARLIREGNYDEALAIARQQVEAGAQIVDVCMDAAMIDAADSMRHFLNLMASEPEIARVPVMIDSSDFSVIEAGLQCTQGKSIVNSISLKEGEEKFIKRARKIMRYGAAVVVMLFDEKGQADTYERKIEVAQRAYRLLVDAGMNPVDIIFDPNILAVATGMPEHDRYARDFIDATRWIKENLPGAKVSGGVSNLSFAFRGNNTVRKAMHSVFLYHAIKAGMDMAIVNPQMVQIYDDIEPQLLEKVEDVILHKHPEAADRLIDYAKAIADDGSSAATAVNTEAWRESAVGERIMHAMLKGETQYIVADTLEAYADCGDAVKVIDTLLMPAMARVGDLFGEGKLFLPQVVKSARVMRMAVDTLQPYIAAGAVAQASASKPVVIATVKGDVHDIGKNIVSVVLACNGFRVIDLGVMVEAERIIDAAVVEGAVAVCLSGLITPSLAEMAHVVEEAERRGLTVPIIVGGATTSDLHTAVVIAPKYRGVVVHSRDAAENAAIVARLSGDDADAYIAELKTQQEALREQYSNSQKHSVKLSTPPVEHHRHGCPCCTATRQDNEIEVINPKISDIAKNINWSFFFSSWGIPGTYPAIFDDEVKGAEAKKLYDDAQAMLRLMAEDNLVEIKGVVGRFEAEVDADDIVLKGTPYRLPMLRNEATGQSVCDFVDSEITIFAVDAGFGLQELTEKYRAEGNEYSAMMAKLLCDRLAEAFASTILPGGCRIALGYPSAPDHSLKREVFKALGAEARTGMRLTESCMIVPAEAVCGMYLTKGRFFDVGIISEAQLSDYANRRGMDVTEVARFIPNNLSAR